VVLGKLVATSINSFYGLLGIFPALAVPLVLGGVTAGEFWRLVLSLINALFFSLSLGLLVSTLAREEHRTWVVTSILILVATVCPILLNWANSAFESIAAISPLAAFQGAFDGTYIAKPAFFWNSIRVVQGMSWVALIAASILLPRVWQDRPVRSRRSAVGRSPTLSHAELRERAELLAVNPALWMACRNLSRPGLLICFCTVAVAIFLGSWLASAGTGPFVALILFFVFAVHLVLSVWVASEACHLSAGGRNDGTLHLLMSTPLTARQIVDGHLRAIRRLFRKPVTILVSVEVFMIVSHHLVGMDGQRLDFWNLVLTGAMLLTVLAFVLELQAAATFGLWMGLCTKRPAHAVMKTVLLVVIFPLATAVCYPIYPFIALAKNLAFTNHAHDQLRRHLRAILTGRSEGIAPTEWIADQQASANQQRGQIPSVQ
jgi:hypothetical protein